MNKKFIILIGISLLIIAIAFAIHLVITPPSVVAGKVADAAKELAATGGKVAEAPEKIVKDLTDFGKYGIDKAADVFREVFQSKVNIVSSTTVCDASPIAELAVLKRNIREIIDYQKTDNGLTKRIIAEQTFVAKIGFDLAARFSASYDSSNQVVTIILPEPKILSLEPQTPSPKRYFEANGDGWVFHNVVTSGDHDQVLIQLNNAARKSAEAALAIGDAKQMVETRFRDLFHAFNVNTVILFPSNQPKIGG